MPGKGSLQLTGKLGEVIRESAQIGLSWVKSHAYELGITSSPTEMAMQDRDVHMHMPEGSIGKEGPSAGTAIVTAYVSLLTDTPVNADIGAPLPESGYCSQFLIALLGSHDWRNVARRADLARGWSEGENPRCAPRGHQDHPRPRRQSL